MKRISTRLTPADSKMRLDDFLAKWIPVALDRIVSKTKIRNLIMSGAIYVNRHRTKDPSGLIFSGAVVEAYIDEKKWLPQESENSGSVTVSILYEDDWLMVVNKPAGIPTQPTIDPNRVNLYDQIKQFLAQRHGQEQYLGLHHRLDRDTSGAVLFTKKEEANKGIARLFQEHQIQKTYHCFSWKSPVQANLKTNDTFEIKNYLGKISEKNENAKFGSVSSGGDPAHTLFRVVETFQEGYWLEAKPVTGRTHQIRVHLSEQGLPILGDPIYFPKQVFTLLKAPRLLLHAHRLEFVHPMTQKTINIEVPLPDDFLKVLESLKG